MDARAELVAAIDATRARGARGAEVFREGYTRLEQAGSRARPMTREGVRWRVRIYLDGGVTGEGFGATAAEALALAEQAARSAPPDPLAGPIDRMPVRSGGMGIDDRRHAAIAEEDRVELLHLAERPFERSAFRLTELAYVEQRVERAWTSTRGFEAAEGATTYSLTATAAGDGVEAQHRIASRHFSDVASLPFGTELRRRIEPLARAVSPPGTALPVVLEPRVLADLVRAIAPAFCSPAVRAGSFVAPYLGRRLASEVIHITDDAGLFGGLRTVGFDERGVPPILVTLLKEGVVHGLYHDPEGARRDGLRPTGHVVEGALRPSNLVVRPGARTRNVILTEMGPHVLIDRLPAVDLTTGRLRGTVPIVLADRHDRLGAWSQAVDLSVVDLLCRVVEVAGDQERNGEVDTPSAVLDGVDVGQAG